MCVYACVYVCVPDREAFQHLPPPCAITHGHRRDTQPRGNATWQPRMRDAHRTQAHTRARVSQPVPSPCQVLIRRLTSCALEAPPTISVPSTRYLGSAHWTRRKPASRPAVATWESLALGWLAVRKTPRSQLPNSIWGMGPGGGGGGWTPWAQKVGSQRSRPGVFPGEPAPLPALTWVSLRRGPSTQQGHLLLTWDQQAMELCPLDVLGPLP